jgi:hypothetical protein
MMDNGTKNYISEYENEFGEPWIFEYNFDNDTGVIKGLDVGWIEYPVLEGRTFGLILDEKEEAWLKIAWSDATEHLDNVGIYSGLDTEFVRDEHGCWLTNYYCPICLNQKREFDEHHCIWSSDGGTDEYFNMLRVCRTCHAVLTWGSVEDRVPKDLAAFYHQVLYFGLEFFPRNNFRKSRHIDRNFLELNPTWKAKIRDFDQLRANEQKKIDNAVKVNSTVQVSIL